MLTITDHAVGDVTILKLRGRLVVEDPETPLGELVDRLLGDHHVKLVFDLRDVTYIDSAGLGLLVSKYVSVRHRGGDLRLVHLTARSHHLFGITKLASIFATFDSETDAVRSFETP